MNLTATRALWNARKPIKIGVGTQRPESGASSDRIAGICIKKVLACQVCDLAYVGKRVGAITSSEYTVEQFTFGTRSPYAMITRVKVELRIMGLFHTMFSS